MENRLLIYLADYESFHKNPMNKITHYVGVYPIVVGTLGLLSFLSFTGTGDLVNLGRLLWLGVSAWYFTLGVRVALLMLPLTVSCLFLGEYLSIYQNLTLFLGGWIVQFWGHYFWEKNSPALFKTLVHLWIAPLWIALKVYKKLGLV